MNAIVRYLLFLLILWPGLPTGTLLPSVSLCADEVAANKVATGEPDAEDRNSELLAGGAPDGTLLAEGAPNVLATMQLVRYLSDRSPAVRQAALGRMEPFPAETAEAVLETLQDGNLLARLSALELFERWQAPTAGLDPWDSDTLTAQRLGALDKWCELQLAKRNAADPESEAPAVETLPITDAQLADARRQIERMLRVDDEQAAVIREHLARFGSRLLDEVYRRMDQAATDRGRQRLRALRYRLVADDSLQLRWPGGLDRLAATDVDVRQQAARELVSRAMPADQLLLLELFGDPDPLVREIGLRGLRDVGGSAATGTLVKLLSDPEPNVRAAVLKQLEEEPASARHLVKDVSRYVSDETNPDLVVHAIRFLRGVGGTVSQRTLMSLLKHDSWQVRAEAAAGLAGDDGLSVSMSSYSDFGSQPVDSAHAELQVEIYAALIKLLDDPDAFVVSRAVEALSGVDMELAVAPLVRAAKRHADLAELIVEMLAGGEKMRPKALPHLREFTHHESPELRAAAIAGLMLATSGRAKEEMLAAFEDQTAIVRIAAAEALRKNLAKLRELQESSLLELLEDDDASSNQSSRGVIGRLYDRWLQEVYAGKHRPKWTAAAVAPLTRMLEAESVRERVAAVLALIPLNGRETAVPVFLDAGKTEPVWISHGALALPWLVWDERKALFRQLRSLNPQDEVFHELIEGLIPIPDMRAVKLCWDLLGEPDPSAKFVYSAYFGLKRGYLGDNYHWFGDDDEWDAGTRNHATKLALEHVASPLPWQRVVALAVLTHSAPREAADAAQQLMDQGGQPIFVQHAAYQVAMAMHDRTARKREALSALDGADPFRRRLALLYLVEGSSVYEDLQVDGSPSYITFGIDDGENPLSSNTTAMPIIPDPPQGLTPDQIASLTDDSDPVVSSRAAYLMGLLGDRSGLEQLLRQRRKNAEPDEQLDVLVYRAIAASNDTGSISILREIYATLDDWDMPDFYWTIRIMSGPEILRFRKQIRDEVGTDNLR